MTLVGIKDNKTSSDMSIGEETKIATDNAPVTAAPPQKEETKKESQTNNAKENAAGKVNKQPFETYPIKLANKIEDNYHLCNKKALFVNMKNYYEACGEDPFDSLPVTFHVKEGLDDPNFVAFKQYYEDHAD